jgi:hypothetical protein
MMRLEMYCLFGDVEVAWRVWGVMEVFSIQGYCCV